MRTDGTIDNCVDDAKGFWDQKGHYWRDLNWGKEVESGQVMRIYLRDKGED